MAKSAGVKVIMIDSEGTKKGAEVYANECGIFDNHRDHDSQIING
jgi:hypothetical protein